MWNVVVMLAFACKLKVANFVGNRATNESIDTRVRHVLNKALQWTHQRYTHDSPNTE